MNTLKSKSAQKGKTLSLDTFREKMIGDINEIKGGAQSCMINSICHVETSGGTVDRCHDE